MKCKNNCAFCNVIEGERVYGRIDTPLYETPNFIVLSTIGALVEGWVLIIPKKCDYSMKSHYSDSEFVSIVDDTKKRLFRQYGKNIIIFEHGANNYGSLTSCGTNHAHLHMLPFSDSLLSEMKKGYDWQKCKPCHIDKFSNNREYLYYCELLNDSVSNTEGHFHLLTEQISQYFRKLIATKIGNPGQYDYKLYPQTEIALKTYNDLSQGV